jgi:hypothetical protein
MRINTCVRLLLAEPRPRVSGLGDSASRWIAGRLMEPMPPRQTSENPLPAPPAEPAPQEEEIQADGRTDGGPS